LKLVTGTPGRNFRQLGFGVSWVWINIVRFGTKEVETAGVPTARREIHELFR
jgi:hypothetical protein